MRKVTVVMSAYNGSKYIKKQLDSIFKQTNVKVTCFVRNDGSTDNTLDILNDYSYSTDYSDLIIKDGENVGWEKSFMLALKDAPQADYYAFSDQDDIWFDDKLSKGIEILEAHKYKNIPIMYHCNKISVTEDFKPLIHQVRRTPKPLNRKNAIIQEYAQGCSIILNEEARQLVLRHIPESKLAHDYWCGLLCYFFGEIIYDAIPRFYHISHGHNASGEGHMLSSWKERLDKFFCKTSIYYMPIDDLLKGYTDILTDTDKEFFRLIKSYKFSLSSKLSLLFSRQFIRDSILGTISLKVAILLNKL